MTAAEKIGYSYTYHKALNFSTFLNIFGFQMFGLRIPEVS